MTEVVQWSLALIAVGIFSVTAEENVCTLTGICMCVSNSMRKLKGKKQILPARSAGKAPCTVSKAMLVFHV